VIIRGVTDVRPPRDRVSTTLAVVLLGFAVLASYAMYRLRGEAAAACDVLERMGGLGLMVAAVLLLMVNVALAVGLWAVFRDQGGLGIAGALFLATVVFAVTSVVFLTLTGVAEGYPTPPGSCPGGRPPWWPTLLPG